MKPIALFLLFFSCTLILFGQSQPGLHVDENHMVLFGQDSTSNGLKLMWQPTKGSLRVGNMTSAWSYNNIGNVSTAFGSGTQASGNYSLAAGLGTEANSYAEVSIGRYALFGGAKTVWDDTGADVVFEIGNGPGPSHRRNMLTVQKSGNVKIGDMTNGAEVIEEKLVVDGGIVLSDAIDDTPKEGTIRWNKDKEDFEGWNGDEWLSLTKSKNKWGGISASNEDGKFENDVTWENLGSSIDVSNDYAVVGAPDRGGFASGRAFVFKRYQNSWSVDGILEADDGSSQDFFGEAVSISGDYIFVGAPGDVGGSVFFFFKIWF